MPISVLNQRRSYRRLTSHDRDDFPYERLGLDKVAILFDKYKNEAFPNSEHSSLPLPGPESEWVVIVLDGIGSSSAGLAIQKIVEWLTRAENHHQFSVCVFSYLGRSTRTYEPRDTVHSDLGDLVAYLDDYLDYYSRAKCIVLVGYSFGGLIISEWLYKHRHELIAPAAAYTAFKGSCLIASPVRLRTTRVYYRSDSPKTAETRGYISAILDNYTAIPEHVPAIAPMVLFRCDSDRLVGEGAYTFMDLPPDDRPVEKIVLDSRHQTIIAKPELKDPLLDAISALCAHGTEMT